MLGQKILVISDVETAKEIMMKRPKVFRRSKTYEAPGSVVGLTPRRGLFFAEGDPWARQRRLSSSAFNRKNTELMAPAIAKQIDSFISRLKSFDVGEVIRMDQQAFFFKITVISAVVLGTIEKERAVPSIFSV